MDVVVDTQKNIARIRTLKEDVARLRGNEVEEKTDSPVKDPRGKIVAVESRHTQVKTIPVAESQKGVSQTPIQKSIVRTLSQADVAKVAQYNKSSILTEEGVLYGEQSLGGGSIIRDIKRKRFRLIPAIVSSVHNWFSETKTAYEDALTGPVHTVAKAKTRLETIKRAVEESRQAPKDDFKEVAQTLKSVPRVVVESTLVVKEKSEIPAPAWTHVEGGETIREEETEEMRDVEETEPVTEETFVDVPPEEEETTPAPSYTEEVVYVPAPPPTPPPPISAQSSVRVGETTSEKPFYLAFAVVIFLATLLGVGVSYYFFGTKAPEVIVTEDATNIEEPLFRSEESVPFILPSDRYTLLSMLNEMNGASSGGVTHFSPTNQNRERAGSALLLEVLAPRAPSSFIRNIETISFGDQGGEPFLVIRTTNFDSAFAGILTWEETMSADLAPLFGEPVFESFNPEVRTSTQTSEAYFADIIASNKNARLLVDENGDDRIVYTFIDQNTILITTTRDVLPSIMQNIY